MKHFHGVWAGNVHEYSLKFRIGKASNVLKTKGYHVQHNFGHGKQYLAAFLLSLNLLAFLFHTLLEWSDDT